MRSLPVLTLTAFLTLSATPGLSTSQNVTASGNHFISENISKNIVKITAKEVNFKDASIEVQLKIPQITGLGSLEIQEKINSQLQKDALSFKNEIEEMAQEYSEETKKFGFPSISYAAFTDYKVNYNKNSFLSLYVDYYRYTGGAHGSTLRKCYNFNLKTGEALNLKDLFKEDLNYKEIINKEISSKIEKHKEIYFSSDFQGISDNQCFSIDGNNLIIYFQQYDIAPYAAGIPEFKIPLSNFKSKIVFN